MNIEMALSVGGFLIGVIGFVYALIANRDKARMEKHIHIRLKGYLTVKLLLTNANNS